MSYQFFYWMHVVSYIIWLLAFVVSLYYGVRISVAKVESNKRELMYAEHLTTSIAGYLAAIGILVSGLVMSAGSPAGWGWFNIQLYPWLTLKQLFFLIILILIGFSLKRDLSFYKKMKREKDLMNSVLFQEWKSAYRFSMVIYVLVIMSTLLGFLKPNLAF